MQIRDYNCKFNEELEKEVELHSKISMVEKMPENPAPGIVYMYSMRGPISILDKTEDLMTVFKDYRKNPEVIKQKLDVIRKELVEKAKELKAEGFRFISYADPPAGVNILGPKMAKQMMEDFTYPFLKELEPLCDENFTIILCPKTYYMLIDLEVATVREIPVEKSECATYEDAILKYETQVKFLGQQCIKWRLNPVGGYSLKEVMLY